MPPYPDNEGGRRPEGRSAAGSITGYLELAIDYLIQGNR